MWYKEWFSSKFYLKLYRHRNDEDARNLVNLIQRTLPLKKDDRVLDIACGAGRHSLELARRGYKVTGFDLSSYLINEARKLCSKAPEKDLHVDFLINDMRNFNFNEKFDLAVNLFTSFGYFEEDKENFSVIKNASDSIKKGAWFVLDFINKEHIIENIVPYSRNKIGDEVLHQRRKIDGDFVVKDIRIISGSKELKYKEVLKLYSLSELKKAFNSFNLKIIKKYGDYFGNPYNLKESKRIILFAQKL
ncbi:MAG TPA: class I SAM-dependent methyltransferase [Ignavibacteria bacterium]|nr:class I SAM-dependent methyltransferase [Ignavibacteria bacterium]